MTIAAELLPLDPAHMSIGISVTNVARRARISMPRTMLGSHESRLVSPRIRAFDTVGVHLTGNAGWIRSLRVVAGSAAFDVPPCQFGM